MNKPRIIPEPKKFEIADGALDLTALPIVLAVADVRISRAADTLRREIADVCGVTAPLRVGKCAPGCVYIAAGDDETKDDYMIDVTENGVIVGASGKRGAFCAVQTLRQLVMLCGAALPLCRIEDEPDYADRGFYHDVTRGRVPKMPSAAMTVRVVT